MTNAVIGPKYRSHGAEASARYRTEGAWRDRILAEVISGEVDRDPQRVLVIDADRTLTVKDLDDAARRLAGFLVRAGIGRGDVVSFQLPNWWEVLVIDAAASFVGAVSNPIIPIYREAEVEFILRDAGSTILFVPRQFRSADFAAMAHRIRPNLPRLTHVVTVRGEGQVTFDTVCAEGPIRVPAAISPDAPRLLLYTSGTTGRAKGVLHSYNTLECEIWNAARTWGLARGDVFLMPSPLTHITGYLYGLCFPEIAGLTAVLMERWDARLAIDLIERHKVTATCSATPFLQELAEAARAAGRQLPDFRLFACGGAPVAPEIVRSATKAFAHCKIVRVYGSTETPTITLGDMSRDDAVSAQTEGFVVGYDVRLVAQDGREVATGEEGEILARGPETMLGYLHEEDNWDAFDEDGYFRSGDLGRFDADGALTITGRKKDLIIRGGENLSAKEIEDVLHEHPGIGEAAVIAMPHPRLGEGVCAYVVLRPGWQLTLRELADFVDQRGLAKQKLPERLEVIEEMPRTATGKIQKSVLRDAIRSIMGNSAP